MFPDIHLGGVGVLTLSPPCPHLVHGLSTACPHPSEDTQPITIVGLMSFRSRFSEKSFSDQLHHGLLSLIPLQMVVKEHPGPLRPRATLLHRLYTQSSFTFRHMFKLAGRSFKNELTVAGHFQNKSFLIYVGDLRRTGPSVISCINP